jgi:hypothetical protein
MKKSIVAVATLFAAGCVSYPVAPPPSPTEVPASASYIAAQDFVVDGRLPENHAKFPMYAIVVLSNNNSHNRKRIKWVCETFINLPPVISGKPGDVGYISQERITPTYWLLKNDVDKNNCNAMQERYDFDRAKAVFSLAGRPGGSGTLLIAYRENKVAVLDLSRAGKRWTKAMVGKWSEALRANGMQDIKIEGGLIADACAAITGDESRRVEATVYEVVKDDLDGNARWFDPLVGVARNFAAELLPFGGKITRISNMTCDQINRSSAIT